MAAREWQLAADDGITLSGVDWPVDAALRRGGVVIMHGLGEHCRRYDHVARVFNDQGWSVRVYDHRGHGRSGGARGDVPDSEALLRDAALVIGEFTQQLGTPPLLLGHSLGGLFAARFATGALAPLRGLILSSPALAIRMNAGQKILLKALSALAPGLAVPNGLQTRYLSHDPAVVQAYERDPLVHPKITPRLLNAMLAAMDFSHAHAADVRIPVLMVVAGDDHLVDASGSERFFPRLRPGIGTFHRFPAMYHEIFNELDAETVFGHVRDWLNTLSAGAEAPQIQQPARAGATI